MADEQCQALTESQRSETQQCTQNLFNQKETVFNDITDQLFNEVRREYSETQALSDEVLSALSCVYQAPLVPALDLVDNRSVTVISCTAGRSLYQVVGSSGTPYTCFTSTNFCTCPSYRFHVLKKEDHKMCKHLLAAKLSEAMDVCKQFSVSDSEMTNMLIQLEMTGFGCV